MITARWRVLLATFVLYSVAVYPYTSAFEIPGTTQTVSGYETSLGEDAMCWISQGALRHGAVVSTSSSQQTITSFPTPLIHNFQLDGVVELLNACPIGNVLTAEPPTEYQENHILRTRSWYNFTATIQLNTTSLIETIGGGIADPSFVSDRAQQPHSIAVQVMVCDVAKTGFCSPFQMKAAARQAAAADNTTMQNTGGDDTRYQHGGTHVQSDYHFVELLTENGPIYEFTLSMPMVVNTAGSYVPILAAQFFFRDFFGMETRYDMANAMPSSQRLLHFMVPPTILQVSVIVRQVVYGLITFVSLVILFLLWQTIKYRNHQVMLLTQGSFLALFLVAALTATIATWLLEPRNQTYCNIGIPLVLISTQLLYAISLGRLWRIHTIISPVLLQTLQEKNDSRKGCWCGPRVTLEPDDSSNNNSSKQLRKKVGWEALVTRVSMWFLPQIIIQICRFALNPSVYGVDWHPDGSIGRCLCQNHHGFSVWAALGYIALCLLMLTLMIQAYRTRSLPSLFNETKDIFDATMITVAIVSLGLGIAAVTNSPSTSPDVYYLIWATINLSSTLNSTLRIVGPKLRMIWRGENVVVSSLLSDHKARVMEDDRLYALKSTNTFLPESCGQDNSTEVAGRYNPWSTTTEGAAGSAASSSTTSPRRRRGRKHNRKIVIAKNTAPAKRLLLDLVEIQQNLNCVNNNVMSGKQVSAESWENLRDQTLTLARTFKTDVEFSWEEKRLFRKKPARKKKRPTRKLSGNDSSSCFDDSTGSERSHCVVSLESMLDDSVASCEISSLESGLHQQQEQAEDGITEDSGP